MALPDDITSQAHGFATAAYESGYTAGYNVGHRDGMSGRADLTLGEFLRRQRRKLGLTIRQVEAECGFPQTYYSYLEYGRLKTVPADRAKRIAVVLKIDVCDLPVRGADAMPVDS